MFQALIIFPEDRIFINRSYNSGTGFTENELTTLNQIKAEITDNICWNTKIYKNEKVVCVIGDTSLIELDSLITLYNLDWLILAASESEYWDIEEQKYIKKILLNFKYSKLKKFLIDDTVLDGGEEFGRFIGDVILEGED